MIKEFNSKKEIRKYFDKITNTYIFKEKGEYITLIVFKFDLNIEANIDANDILARNINAYDIKAHDINAWDIDVYNINAHDINTNTINAHDIYSQNINADNIKACDIDADNINVYDINAMNISYYAVCFAYYNIKCKSIKGMRHNAKHFVLDGKLEVEENDKY